MTDKTRNDHQSHLNVQAKEISAEEFKITGRKIVVSKKKRISGLHRPHQDNCPSYEVENGEINEFESSTTLRSPSNVSTAHASRPSFLITFVLSWLRPGRVDTEQSHVCHAAGRKYEEKRYVDVMTPIPQIKGVSQSEKTTNNRRMISGPVASFLSLKIPLNRSPKVKPIEPIFATVVSPAICNHILDLSTHSFHGSDSDPCITPGNYLPFSRHCSVEQELFKLEVTKFELPQDE